MSNRFSGPGTFSPNSDAADVIPTSLETWITRRARRRTSRLARRARAWVERRQAGRTQTHKLTSGAIKTEWRLSEAEARIAGLSGLVVTLLTGQPLTPGDQVDVALVERIDELITQPEQALALVHALVDCKHPLAADHLATRFELRDQILLPQRRRLASELRARGYLERALAYVDSFAAEGLPRDEITQTANRAEVELLSGAFHVHLEPTPVEPVPGRVLHVVTDAMPQQQTGYTIRTNYIVQAELAAGLEPHVVTQFGAEKGQSPGTDDVDGVPHHRLGSFPRRTSVPTTQRMQRNAEELLALVTKVRPAILHAHSNFWNGLAAEAVGAAAGIPVVYEVRGFWEISRRAQTADDHGWTDPEALAAVFGHPDSDTWRGDRESDAIAGADHVVTLARTMLPRILESGIDESKTTLVGNAVDVDAFAGAGRDADLARELGVEKNDIVIGYVSSMVAYEGIDTLVRAFAALRDKVERPVHLVLAGDGRELPGLKALVADLGVAGVTFTGKLPHADIARYYGMIDIFVVPRKPYEVCHLVTPLKPFEAFAAGRAVVMSDVDALREIAADSQAAELFEAGNVDSLTAVLAGLVGDDGRRNALADRGRSWVREHRTWAHSAAIYREIYAKLGAL